VKRPLKPEERHVWGLVAATVHPLPGRATPKAEVADALPAAGKTAVAAKAAPSTAPRAKPPPPRPDLDGIEPRRKRRIARERDPIGARLDLHGLDQDRARGVLDRFLVRAWDEGYRAVLIITGKGVQGDGVLKRRTPEWLAASHLAHIVAGISDAARHHGGEGALYVALKRKPRG
jgi:DNA-nicking Smr family endonuclease